MPTPNSQMQEILDAHAAMGPLPIERLSPELARVIPLPDRAAAAVYGQHFTKRALAPMPQPVGKVEHQLVNSEVMARVYTPQGDTPQGGWPAILYFHGGGWVIANLDTYDSSCRALCDGAEAVVISIHYRQAPENPWPAAVEDAYEAYQWVLKNASTLRINTRQLAVAGESAGGNLAAVTCLLVKNQGLQAPCHQLLVYPVTDLANGMNSASAKENAHAKPLNRAMLHWFYDHYVPDVAQRRDPRISPLFARDLGGLPDTTILLAEIDPLRSDGEAYAARLEQAGVNVHLQVFDGVTHEFFGMAGLVSEATEAMKTAVADLRAAFDRAAQPLRKSA